MQNVNCKLQIGQRRAEGVPGDRNLGKRSKSFALRINRLYSALPKSTGAQVIGRQLLRSGTSVGAQYREADCARSKAEFVSKMGGARQELNETIYWLELLVESGLVPQPKIDDLLGESRQRFAMFTASINTAKRTAPR